MRFQARALLEQGALALLVLGRVATACRGRRVGVAPEVLSDRVERNVGDETGGVLVELEVAPDRVTVDVKTGGGEVGAVMDSKVPKYVAFSDKRSLANPVVLLVSL